MPDKRKRRGLHALESVATFTLVEIRSRHKLAIVLIFVAIGALLKLNLEERVFAFGNMALRALDREVFSFELVSRGGVIFRRKRRRLETFHGMAGRAFNARGPLGELAVVRIRMVTIHALGEGDRLFEISARVAARTIHGGVLALQRILGLGVIEVSAHRRHGNSLPAFGVVAGLAALRETAVVRIGVAIRAFGKRDSGIARLAVRARRMTLLALHLRVQSGQWKSRLAVIELPNRERLPIGKVVALQAICAQAPFMLIFVAGGASLRNA